LLNGLLRTISHDEVARVRINRPTEAIESLDSMHRQRCLVGIGDRLVRLDQDNPFRDAGDDLLQLRSIRVFRQKVTPRLPQRTIGLATQAG
jgi:hypothetical protein